MEWKERGGVGKQGRVWEEGWYDRGFEEKGGQGWEKRKGRGGGISPPRSFLKVGAYEHD